VSSETNFDFYSMRKVWVKIKNLKVKQRTFLSFCAEYCMPCLATVVLAFPLSDLFRLLHSAKAFLHGGIYKGLDLLIFHHCGVRYRPRPAPPLESCQTRTMGFSALPMK
jgi:hypothetical protein